MAGKGKAAPKKATKGKAGKVKPGSIVGGFIRTGHGAGAGTPHVEVPPADELDQPPDRSVIAAQAGAPQRDAAGRFVSGNHVSARPRTRPNKQGTPNACDPAFRPFRRHGKAYAAARRADLAAVFGHVSASVAAIIESEAQALAASRYFDSVAATTLDVELFKRAADLGALARQHALCAYQLCSRESVIRNELLTLRQRPQINIVGFDENEPDEDAPDQSIGTGSGVVLTVGPDAEAARMPRELLGDAHRPVINISPFELPNDRN